jgi:hypothetical protein
MSSKTDLENYYRGLKDGNTALCAKIELKYDVYGYPPNLVCVALQAVVDGRNPYAALDETIGR